MVDEPTTAADAPPNTSSTRTTRSTAAAATRVPSGSNTASTSARPAPTVPQASAASDPSEQSKTLPDPPVRPYAGVPDASAAGDPKVRDFAYEGQAQPKTAPPKATPPAVEQQGSAKGTAPPLLPPRREPAYRNIVGVYDPQALDRVFERNFGASPNVLLSTNELINISDGARKRLHAMTSLSRQANSSSTAARPTVPPEPESVTTLLGAATGYCQATVEEVPDEPPVAEWSPPAQSAAGTGDEEADTAVESVESYKFDAAPGTAGELRVEGEESSDESSDEEDSLAPGMYRLDPRTFQAGDIAHAPLKVGRPTHKLRSIWAVIADSALPVECVLDPGSQIVAMSERCCIDLGIRWDPTSRMNMISANNTSNLTCGLARDVPLEIGDGLIVYLQLHVISHASYDVLLGRPFDVLMATSVQNRPDGDQLLTVTCPNTGRVETIPTFARGVPPKKRTPLSAKGFRTSMI